MSEYKCKICDGDLAYKRTREDFFEGDSVEIFKCLKCGKTYERYIPR